MQEELKRVLLTDIVPDPNQPRKHFSEVALQELTESVKLHGVLQAIVLRPLKSKNKGRYMLVAGERRFQASKAAGLKDIPAMIQELTDKEALDIQITENLQRQDINPMEEAQAFQNILKGKVYSVEGLAARIAKRPEYVRQRVRLCELTLLWQELLYASKLRIADANLICRFAADVQVQFYSQYVPKDWEQKPEGWVLPAMHLVEKTKNLNEAPFKTEDPTLNPKMGPCGQCPYNSAVSQLAFPGEEGQRICSNPACYSIKEQNNHRQKVQASAKENVLLIAGGTYSPQAKEEIKVAEELGGPVLDHHAYEILKQPEHLSQIQYEKRYSWKMDGKPDEVKAELYKEYEQEVATKEAEYNFKKQHAQKALVVAADYGLQKGEIVEVYVPQPEPEAIVQEKQLEEQILKLQQQKKKAIEQANQDFLKDLAKALRLAPAYWNNEKPVEIKDCLAMLQVFTDLEETYDQEILEEMRIEWGSSEVKTENMLTTILSTSKTGFLYKWLRRLTVSKITEFQITDAGGVSLRLLAERYIPKELDALAKLYKEKQKEIIDRTNEQINALQQPEILEAA